MEMTGFPTSCDIYLEHHQDGGQLPPGGVRRAAGGGAGGDAPDRGDHAAHGLQRCYTALDQQVDLVVAILLADADALDSGGAVLPGMFAAAAVASAIAVTRDPAIPLNGTGLGGLGGVSPVDAPPWNRRRSMADMPGLPFSSSPKADTPAS